MKQLSEVVRVESATAYRIHDVSKHGTVEMGDTEAGIRLAPRRSLEFVLVVGDPEGIEPSVEIAADECKIVSSGARDDGLIIEFAHRDPDVNIKVYSTAAPEARLRKWLVIENTDAKPLMLFDVALDRVLLPPEIEISGGGRGWPVFIKDVGFAAVEFPESECIVSESQYSLEYYPAVVLQPGESHRTESALLQFCAGDPMPVFQRCIDEIKTRRRGQLYSCYSSRGAHESEGPNEHIVNDEIDNLIDLKGTWRVPFEHFIIDYGYWRNGEKPWETGDFTVIDTDKRFPGGSLDHIRERIRSAGMKLGMWFGNGCPARETWVSKLLDSILQLSATHELKLARIHIAEWDCTDTTHDHSPGRYMRYKGARNLIHAFEAVKAADPEIVIHATGFTRSPWWLRYVDLIGKDVPDISDTPAPSMRDSEIIWTDSDHLFFETDPGTCVTYSDSHFWAGRQCWRKGILMSLARSNQIALSGQLGLLDEDDRLFLQRVYHMRKVHASSFEETRRVDLGFGVYGYADTANGRGVVALYNPSWEPRVFRMSAESLGCDPSLRNVCVELFPDTRVAAIPPGGHYDRPIEPWQVIWFEVGPSEEKCEEPSGQHKETRNVPMLVTPVSVPADVPNVIPMPVEQVLFSSGSTFRCSPVLPRTWQGFPLCIDYSTGDGEIYINNQPLVWHDGAAYALLWPWTRRYGMMRFGKPNMFYMATDDVTLTRQPDIVFSALSYFSGSACREDWPYPSDCTLVALIRFLKDGEPFRYSHDPRTVRCAVWMDGVWTEVYRMPPNVPHIRTQFSWSVFMLDLEGDWECVRVLVPQLVDCDYEVEFLLTDRLTAAEYIRGD